MKASYILIIYIFIGHSSGITSVVVPTKYESRNACKEAAEEAVNDSWKWTNPNGNQESNKVTYLCIKSGNQNQ